MSRPLNVAIVGLGFGAEFIPIYQKHPQANLYAICQRDQAKLDAIGNAFNIERRYRDYAELLKDPQLDAVHINTPIHLHAPMAIAALEAGKHVACRHFGRRMSPHCCRRQSQWLSIHDDGNGDL